MCPFKETGSCSDHEEGGCISTVGETECYGSDVGRGPASCAEGGERRCVLGAWDALNGTITLSSEQEAEALPPCEGAVASRVWGEMGSNSPTPGPNQASVAFIRWLSSAVGSGQVLAQGRAGREAVCRGLCPRGLSLSSSPFGGPVGIDLARLKIPSPG